MVAQASLDLWIALLRSNLKYLCDCHPGSLVYILYFVSETFVSHGMRDMLVDLTVSLIGCVNMDEPQLSWVSISLPSE